MALRPLSTGSGEDPAAQAAAANALAVAEAAQADADNAKQMVRNRDPRLLTLEEQQAQLATAQAQLSALAASYGNAVTASEATHAQFATQIAAVQAANAGVLARLAALEAKGWKRQTKTVTTSAGIILGGSLDVTCTWDTAWPDATYTLIPLLDSTGLQVSMVGPTWKSQTATTATVTIKALVAIAAGVKIRFEGVQYS